jgi:gliding motility-associated-like protein
MKQLFTALFWFLLFPTVLFATHERAGEIVYRHIDGLKYEVTILTYTYTPSPADRPQLTISWGDGTTAVIDRTEVTPIIPNLIQRNVYIGEHTYIAPGVFKLSVEDPNRNYGIVNIPNSVNIPFYIETELVINPFLGPNSSVVLLNPPLDYACIDKLFIHNPAAYDPDGDSISYKLTICRGAGGLPIPGYAYPNQVGPNNPGIFEINENTGDLVWDTPKVQGEYNAAFLIEEWRYGQRIGYVTRDLQIEVVACDNNPPEITVIPDTCVNAGDSLIIQVLATDPDGDQITLSAIGSPFLQNESPAALKPNNPVSGVGSVTAFFNWGTKCSHVLKNPHSVYFKAVDNDTISLSSYKTLNISVVGPAPENLTANPLGNSIILDWENTLCDNISGYYVFRKNSYYGFIPGHCEVGVPSYTGYAKTAQVDGLDNTGFIDSDNSNGLIHGIEYCYMVTTFFPDGAESYATPEVCASLKRDLPIITNVSVENTGETDGSMYLAWSKPTELDTIQIPGPFEYQLFRKKIDTGNDFVKITSYHSLNDTIFTDPAFNTRDYQYVYHVDLLSNNDPENPLFIGSTENAPSIFLSIEPTDKALKLNWDNNVPWINETWQIYRQNEESGQFEMIAVTNSVGYLDDGLENGKEYCYKIKSIGKYSVQGLVNPIINYSQVDCGVPVDNIPPCEPILTVLTDCDSLLNKLSWTFPLADSCQQEDSIYFNIYYSSGETGDYSLIYTTPPFDSTYTFRPDPPVVVGCFAITALDTMHNESHFSNAVCVDINQCGSIWFPIVFTPNGDNWNNYFHADSIHSVAKFRLSIFNRWGTVVYKTEDPFFKWDGKDQNSSRDCTEGVYFYEGIVSLYSLKGPIDKKVRGSVTLIR